MMPNPQDHIPTAEQQLYLGVTYIDEKVEVEQFTLWFFIITSISVVCLVVALLILIQGIKDISKN